MSEHLTLLGLELLVEDLDRAVALFVDVLGFEVHQRGRSDLIAGEIAVVTDGRIAITLLEPTTEGDAPILPDRQPRLSQFIFGVDSQHVDAVAELVVETGLSVTPTGSGFFVSPESIEGMLGIETAVVVTRET